MPGLNDPANEQIIPSLPLNDYFASCFDGIKNLTLACNPCRLSFYGKQIVICRYNYLKRLKKNSLCLGGDLARSSKEDEDAENGKCVA